MVKKRNKNTLVLLAFIFTMIHLGVLLLASISLMFNLFGIVDYLGELLLKETGGKVEIDSLLSSYYFDMLLSAVVNISAGISYFKGYKFRVNNPAYATSLILNGVIQLLFSSYISGVLAIVAGVTMKNKKKVIDVVPNDNPSMVSDYKLQAMSEAVLRLKELRASGEISEEEYYASLNKILEG